MMEHKIGSGQADCSGQGNIAVNIEEPRYKLYNGKVKLPSNLETVSGQSCVELI